ncbi:3746_t:CDS:2 [Cetraspora pellucida]|uniref:3746_t:CDS:1 n=1 Tax=Cetraspora pellucida TaxID=1433469 RepID=A0ACA9MJT9_9GLOM|nr:3746_t:CDS:2 [Cetraspora pellucida]
MPKEKGDYWKNYDEIIENGKVRYKCKLGCEGIWAKNETRLKEHSQICNGQSNASKNKQSTLDNFVRVVSKQDQKVYDILLTRAFISSGIPFNVIENPDFRFFLQKTNPSYTIPSRYRVSNNLLNQEYNYVNQTIYSDEDINVEETNKENYNDLNLLYDSDLNRINNNNSSDIDSLYEDSENSQDNSMDY